MDRPPLLISCTFLICLIHDVLPPPTPTHVSSPQMPSFLPHGLEVFLPLSAHLEHLSTDPLQVGGAAIPTPMRAAISHKRPVAYHSPGTSHRSTFSLARESNTEAPHSCLRRAGLESLTPAGAAAFAAFLPPPPPAAMDSTPFSPSALSCLSSEALFLQHPFPRFV